MSRLARSAVVLVGAIALSLVLVFAARPSAVLADDQPDGSIIDPDQDVHGTWGPGTITATADVTIQSGVVITVAPNTTIVVADGVGFTINGDLHSDGPATFTTASSPATPGAWSGITYAGGSTGYLNQATVEYAVHALTLNTANPITVSSSILRHNRHQTSDASLAYGAGLYIQQGNHLIEQTHIYENTATAAGTGQVRGAGVYIVSGAPHILDSWIYENTATGNHVGAGGGIGILGGAPLIENSHIVTNTMAGGGNARLKSGGGIGFAGATSAIIRRCWIAGNRNVLSDGYAGGGGIGFGNGGRASLIEGSVIYDNYIQGPDWCEGSGIDTWDTTNAVLVRNNLIASNTSGTCLAGQGAYGGGINMNGGGAGVHLINNTIVNNVAGRGGGAYMQGGTISVRNNIVVNNQATIAGHAGGIQRDTGTADYNDIFGNSTPQTRGTMGANNLYIDPLFLGIGDLAQRYHLSPCSPLIDAGTDPGSGLVDTDYDGESRPQRVTWDIGLDEVGPSVGTYVCKSALTTGPVAPGQSVTFTVKFGNLSSSTATDVVLTDTIPSGMLDSVYTNSGATIAPIPGETFAWDVQDLAQNEGGVITITGIVGLDLFGGSVDNIAEIESSIGYNAAGASVGVCDTIQCMIDAADPGDTVIVPAGMYVESLNLTKPVSLTGVSSATVVVQAPASNRVMYVDGSDITNDVVISGMTFTGGNVTGDGGGIYITNGAQPRFEAVIISGNTARYRGGGIYMDSVGATLIVAGSVITGNETTYNNSNARGGGIYLVGAGDVLVVTDSTISDNIAELYGGAVFYDSPTGFGSVSITDSEILDNEATRYHGGGIYAARAVMTVTNSTISGNWAPYADRAGGGIYLRGAGSSLTVDSSTFSDNVARRQGGAIYGYDNNIQIRIFNDSVFTGNETTEDDSYSQGGAIYLYGTGTALTIVDSVLSGNISERYGGAIYVYAGNNTSQVSISNTEIVDNEATDLHGGGVYVYRATTRIENSLISGNTANGGGADGGGLFLNNTPAVISNTTVYSNSANDDGGGIYGYYGSLTLANSTVSGNSTTVSTSGDGGGVNTYYSTVNIYNTTIFDNSAIRYGGGLRRQSSGNVRFYNSIVAGNSAGTSGANCSGTIAAGSGNLASDASCPVGGGFTIDPDSALLGSLSDNGGETPTHLILPGNPAVEGGDNSICAAAPVNGVDQRGVVRPQGANCDVGSLEVPASLVVTKSGSNEDGDPLRPGETILYTIRLSNSSALANTGVVVTDTFPVHTTYVPDSLSITPPSAGGTPGTQPVLVEGLTVDADSEVVVTYEVSVSIPLTDGVVIENTATATSVEVPYPASSTVSDTVVATPAVKVVKEGWDVADVGDTVVYTFTVTNIGDTLLHNLVVDDDVAGLATLVSGDDGDGWLDLTEAWVYRATYTIQPTDPDPVDNTVTVTAFDAVGTETSDSDDHSMAIVYNPVLSIAKDGPDTADVGDVVGYTFTVSHDPGSDGSPVGSITVDDTIAGAAAYDSGDDGDSLLEMGESWVYTADYAIQPTDPDPLVNGATVAGEDPEGDDVSAQASHSLDVEYAPALSIEKLGQSSAGVGETVLFFFLVGNDTTNGDGSPISNVTVTDDVAGPATLIGSDDMLEGGEVWIYMATYTIQPTDPSPLVNVGTVEGVDRDGDLVANTADHATTLRGYEPALSIVKDGPESAPMGATVVYSFTVTNDDVNGDGAPVGNLTVSDDIAGPATYVEGDDGDGYLSVGESWTYTASYTIQLSDSSLLVNTGTVEGQDPEGDTVTASGEHSTIIDYVPGIEITKTPDTQTIAQGADAAFTITVSNTGDSPLDVEVTDVQSPDCSQVIGTLSAGEDNEYTCSATGVTGDYVNSATAVGSPPTGEDVTDTDTAIVDVLPTVAVIKSADPSSVDEPGGTVTFTVRVENTSEETLTLDLLVDVPHGDLNGEGTCSVPQTIAVGEAYECEFAVLITGDGGDSETDTVTASVSDDEANTINAEDSATVEIIDVPPPVTLTKIADPTEVAEPGDHVTFTVRVVNTSTVDSVTIDTLTDDIHGDLDGQGTCDVPQTIGPDETYECEFSAFVGGNAGDSETDTVTASGTDDDGTPVEVSDDATVTITDVASSITVSKRALPDEVSEPGGNVTFIVRVDNTSPADTVTISSLVDDVHGDLDGEGTCSVPRVIPAGGLYECNFVAFVGGNAGDIVTDTVTASGTDDDATAVNGEDSATVEITDVPSSIAVSKSAVPSEVSEPGSFVNFAVRVDNTSAVDSVTIDGLTDNIHLDLHGQGTCAVPQTIAAGAFYECSFSAFVGGNAGDSETDTVLASGTDDDGASVSASDDATVSVVGTPSFITVTKTADPTSVPEPGGDVTFTVQVENGSAVDVVTITTFLDDFHGDLDGQGTCSLPQTIATDGTYECEFSAFVGGNAGDVFTDTVIASGSDDDGDPVSAYDDATVTITDLPSSVTISKTADPVEVAEPGGDVTFTVRVDNASVADSVTIDSLTDDLHTDLGTCTVPQTIAAGEAYECAFSAFVGGNVGDSETDTVTASGSDDDGNSINISDSATVAIIDAPSSIVVTKTAEPAQIAEPGGDVTFTVRVENTSAADSVTIASLVDDLHGDLDDQDTCAVPQTIGVGGAYECEFSVVVSGNAGYSETDTITASGTDSDGVAVEAQGSATVDVIDVPSSITVLKTADPVEVAEPGGDVTFTVRVENTSAVDSVTINSLVDDIHGDLSSQDTCAVPQTIAAGEFYECAFSAFIAGEAGDSETDVITASGTDDDANPVSAQGSVTVDVTDVPSSISVTKTADPAEVAEPGGDVTFTVRVDNTSAVDSVTIEGLTDDVHGNLDGRGTCAVPQTIAAGGFYECEFSTFVGGNAGESETDTVTASGTDDDANPVSAQGNATVDITDVPSSLAVSASAVPPLVAEPGANVIFIVEVENTSAVDILTVDSLADDLLVDLNGQGSCSLPRVIAPGAAYECHYSAFVGGNAGDSVTNTFTASGSDDDGQPVSAQGEATVTITDRPSSISVIKTPDPTSVPETGDTVTFTVRVENTSAADSVTIESLVDDTYGDLDGQGTCAVPQTIAAGEAYECEFGGFVSGDAGESEIDVITASGVDDDGNAVSASAEASVAITDVPSSIAVIKTADPSEVAEPGGDVTFTVRVENTSAVDSVTVKTLVDDVHGDLDEEGTCSVPQTIAAGGFYECMFSAFVGGDVGESETDTVTGSGTDDDDQPVSAQGSATVSVVDAPASIAVIKSADPSSVPEPGGDVVFTVRIENTSAADSVTVESLVDDLRGDLNGQGTCAVPQTIPVGAWYECQFSALVSGSPGDSETDIITVSGTDSDGANVDGQGSVTVMIEDVLPSILVTAAADPLVVRSGDLVDFAIQVHNTSVEPITVTGISDSIQGDLSSECALPTSVTDGAFFECIVSHAINFDQTNIVSATVADDEGNVASGSAEAPVDVIGPAVRITGQASTDTAELGEAITYTCQVENVGDVTLVDIEAIDDRLGPISLISTTLEPGEVTVGTIVYEVVEADLPGPLVYTVTVTAVPPVGEDVSDTDTVVVNFIQPAPPMRYVYLPLTARSTVPIQNMAPDLVIDSIALTTDNVEIVIKNQGYAPVVHTFWVDLYIDPDPVPTGVNQTWEKLCDEGIVWGVLGLDGDLPLVPGDAITLTLNDAYYCVPGAVCNFSGSFHEGLQIYVQVDSADERTDYGAVLETHEMAGEAYNNISGPVTPGAADLGPSTQPDAEERHAVAAHNLPPR